MQGWLDSTTNNQDRNLITASATTTSAMPTRHDPAQACRPVARRLLGSAQIGDALCGMGCGGVVGRLEVYLGLGWRVGMLLGKTHLREGWGDRLDYVQ
jgi:hypothetical protein